MYAIENAISNDKQKELFFLEFGAYKGNSTNFFSKYVKKLYAFEMYGHYNVKGYKKVAEAIFKSTFD